MKCSDDKHGPWSQTAWLRIIVLACVTQGELLSFSAPHFKNGNDDDDDDDNK